MKYGFRPLAALLAILAVQDLVMVPIMAHANPGPPLPATVLSGVLGIATLVSIPGLARGRTWAYRVALVSRIVDALNAALGAAFGPAALFVAVGAAALILSIAAIVLLVRLHSRTAGLAASGA